MCPYNNNNKQLYCILLPCFEILTCKGRSTTMCGDWMSAVLQFGYLDTSLCPACTKRPINSQPVTVAHTGRHTDEPKHAQGRGANRSCLESTSASSREAVVEERQTAAQTGWWKTQSGLAGWVSDDEKGPREWHMAPITALFSICLICQPPPPSHSCSLPFSFAHCLSSSLSLFLSH